MEKEVGALLSQQQDSSKPNEVFVAGDAMITSLGFSLELQVEQMREARTGITWADDPKLAPEPFYVSLTDHELLEATFHERFQTETPYTRLEKLALLSVDQALAKSKADPSSSDTIFILSTTKGNIDLLEDNRAAQFDDQRAYLWKTARILKDFFGNPNRPVTVSNACASGVLAINTAADLLKAGCYRHAVVIGADIISAFTASGFQSFKAIATTPCRPFDKEREGLTLGEGSGAIVLSVDREAALFTDKGALVQVTGGGTSNDANHISGPSRTGEELYFAIQKALNEANVAPPDIHYLSAHGTATEYNDEMEAKAFHKAGLDNVPINSLKGFFGHTLGAAGVIESVGLLQSLCHQELYPTKGFANHGVSTSLNINDQYQKGNLTCCLKTASGFGGCNAAVVFSAHE